MEVGLWFGGCVSISQSVSQLTSLYLSQWVQSCLLDDWDTWSPRPQSLPSHHPTHNCHVNSFSDSSHPLGLCPNTIHGSPFPLEKKSIHGSPFPSEKNSTQFRLIFWGTPALTYL